MKKALFLFAATLLSASVWAQTIVSTEVEKRNVLIEEFTGIRCGYCPDGHYRANQICDYFYGHAWAINIHEGGYATGSGYTTTYGDNIASLWDIEGYPCGVTNRCNTMQNRGQWAASATQVRNEDSPVNLAARGELNVEARTLTVHLEAYNTGTTNASAYLLNIAVLQNNVIGTQANYGPYNTDYITDDGKYRHMHMLRDLLTGQWGVEISSAQGTFFDTTFVYNIPESINGLAVPDVHDIELVAFLTAPTHKNVITAAKVILPKETAELHSLNAYQATDCALEYKFDVMIENYTTKNISSITLSIDGTETTFPVNFLAYSVPVFEIPSYTFTVSGDAVQHCSGTKTVSFLSYTTSEGETVTVNSDTLSVDFGGFNIYSAAGPFIARVGIDHYGSEAGVELVNQENCSVLWHEGPWTNLSGNPSSVSQLKPARYTEITFSPATAGLYIFRLTDSYGDGWYMTNASKPSGVWMRNAAGEIFSELLNYETAPIVFSHRDYYLNVTNAGDGSESRVGIDNAENVTFGIYPNPATDRLSIICNEAVREVSVMDVSGRNVMTLNNTNSIDVRTLAAGVYMLRVATENGVATQKFVKE